MTRQSIAMISSTIIDNVKSAQSIAVIGNGGNLAIAKHAASDMSRHLNKFGSNADLLIGVTTRLDSPIAKALEYKHAFIFAPKKHPRIPTIVINKETFHEFEVETLWNFYMLMEKCGAVLPSINN